ncbi:MAG: diaminopimelate epimerase, partial [Pseudomonadota bacterium]
VDMGAPRFDPGEIPMRAAQAQLVYTIPMGDQTIAVAALSMGNPHAILEVPDVDRAPVADLGPRLATHPAFPNGVNAGFMQRLDRARIRLRVFERGVGETLACGTGACAAVVAGRRLQRLDEVVDVELPGGHLLIRWEGPGHAVWMTGPAQEVFYARIEI